MLAIAGKEWQQSLQLKTLEKKAGRMKDGGAESLTMRLKQKITGKKSPGMKIEKKKTKTGRTVKLLCMKKLSLQLPQRVRHQEQEPSLQG